MPLERLQGDLHRRERVADLVRDERRESSQVFGPCRRVGDFLRDGDVAHQRHHAARNGAEQQLRLERLRAAEQSALFLEWPLRGGGGQVAGGSLTAGE